MNWDDTGFLVSKNRYNENSLITEIFTENHGKISGIIFGATSKKIKNYLQLGNRLYVNYNTKSVSRVGYFKIEISSAFTPFYFDHKEKLSCITSAMNLIKILTPESQVNKNVYYLIEKFYVLLNSDNWIQKYIFWELELLKILGFDLELKNLVKKKIIDNKTEYFVNSTSGIKNIPNFLIDQNIKVYDLSILLNGLKLVGDYLEKTILKPNNMNNPIPRLYFVNLLK